MHIAIDARFWGIQNTGLGRYVMNLVLNLALIDRENTYSILVRAESYNHIKESLHEYPNFHVRQVEANHYSVKEQLSLPFHLKKINPDLLHVPHFNIPIFWKGRLAVTIHDLIKQSSPSTESTTLPKAVYMLKYHAHLYTITSAVKRASTIFVPSQFTADQLESNYPSSKDKIIITPEAPDPIYYTELSSRKLKEILKTYQLQKPYLLYVGNVYPHKNIPILLQALKQYNNSNKTTQQLIIVCARNIFQQKVAKLVKDLDLELHVRFLHLVPDEDLVGIYQQATSFVTPSLLEGFGLPGLEAMAAGTSVISAQASCLPEIYQKHAVYFDPQNPDALASKINQVTSLSPSKRSSLIKSAKKHAQTFSWQRLAEQTLEGYRQV